MEKKKKEKKWLQSFFYFGPFQFCSIEGEAVHGDTW